MARFSIRFLGCKVSQTDAQAVRERLLADGHMESDCADVAVVNTCCVTHEAVRKSRHAVSRAARTHARVYVTGCGANLAGDAFAGMPANVRVMARRTSIEVNHVSDELVAALRETPTLARHLHVPLQSGDDRVLRAMARRYTSTTYLRRLEALGDFNLTTDVIVGFPGEDEPAFRRTVGLVRAAGITKVHVFPYSPRPGTRTAAEDSVPPAIKKDRGSRLRAVSHAACIERWRSKLGTDDVVLVDRPGRGYGDDYSPWLVDAPVGELVRVRAGAVSEEGILAA